MTASRFAALAVAVLLNVGCSNNNGPNGGGPGGPGGSGDTGTTDCKLAGEWVGKLTVRTVDGVQLPAHMQIQLPVEFRFAFNSAGHVTQTVNGRSVTFARVGEEFNDLGLIGTNSTQIFRVTKLTASANRIELHVLTRSQEIDDPGARVEAMRTITKNTPVEYAFALKGEQLDVRLVQRHNSGGRIEVVESLGLFQRVGGGNGGQGGGRVNSGQGGW